MKLDLPNVSPQSSNEQNIQALKGYIENMVFELTNKFDELENRIEKLEKGKE